MDARKGAKTFWRRYGTDIATMTPLCVDIRGHPSREQCIGCRTWRRRHMTCTCSSEPYVNYTEIIVSVCGNPVKLLPVDAVYNVKVASGFVHASLYDDTLENPSAADTYIEFNVTDTIDESEDIMRHNAQTYLKNIVDKTHMLSSNVQLYNEFVGLRSAESYCNYFLVILQKLFQDKVIQEPKDNPHVEQRRKGYSHGKI